MKRHLIALVLVLALVLCVGVLAACKDKVNIISTDDFAKILETYNDYSQWNFSARFQYKESQSTDWDVDDVIKCVGDYYSMTFIYEGETLTDYIDYDQEIYYADNGDGTWEIIDAADEEMGAWYDYYVLSADFVNIADLGELNFEITQNGIVAKDANDAGDAILGDWGDDCTWTSLSLTVSDGNIAVVTAVQEDTSEDYAGTYTYVVTFYDWGKTTITMPDASSGEGGNEGGSTGGGSTGEEGGDNYPSSLNSKADFLSAVITTPTEGVSYKLALWHNSQGKVLYWTGEHTSKYTWYMATTDNVDSAADVEVKVVSGGYYLYCPSTGKYLQMTERSDKAGSGTLELVTSTPSTVMQIDATTGYITITNGSNSFFLGSYSDYNTISANNTSNMSDSSTVDVTQYPARLVMLGTGGSTGGGSTSSVMPEQSYDESTFDNSNLQDKMFAYEHLEYGDTAAIGLPSTGTYSALVVPVQFNDTTIDSDDLSNLNKAFNGSTSDTGWQSVKTFYEKESYGKLNLSFDIWGVNIGTAGTPYISKNNYSYYETSSGDETILLEVLSYLEDQLDLTKYDTNGDGSIDAVYIIYSAPVNYVDDDSIWWAYVTWYTGDQTFDGLYPYYYLFAGLDFMTEEVRSGASVAVNAETYIHETGHLLGLDDYYDYYIGSGSDQGMGGASMQDFNIGEHDSYSKIMMGWIEPTIVTTSQTFTIDLSNSNTNDDCALIFLNGNNSYFCEYLLIDLFSATNELNDISSSDMFDGANCGVRIYHVSSWCDDPYSDDYGSFTNYNNSLSSTPLIKLVEADGETTKNTSDNQGYWTENSDLWQEGQSLNTVFSGGYTRNDGKIVNFNITIGEVTNTTAVVTITFAE